MRSPVRGKCIPSWHTVKLECALNGLCRFCRLRANGEIISGILAKVKRRPEKKGRRGLISLCPGVGGLRNLYTDEKILLPEKPFACRGLSAKGDGAGAVGSAAKDVELFIPGLGYLRRAVLEADGEWGVWAYSRYPASLRQSRSGGYSPFRP